MVPGIAASRFDDASESNPVAGLAARAPLGYGPGVLDALPSADVLLRDLAGRTDDVELRERAARALVAEDRPGESVAVLQDGLIQLNAHDPGALPCLCVHCITPDRAVARVHRTANATDPTTFHRDFVVVPGSRAVAGSQRGASGRVLFFWIPEDLVGRRRRVRGSVLAALRARFPGQPGVR